MSFEEVEKTSRAIHGIHERWRRVRDATDELNRFYQLQVGDWAGAESTALQTMIAAISDFQTEFAQSAYRAGLQLQPNDPMGEASRMLQRVSPSRSPSMAGEDLRNIRASAQRLISSTVVPVFAGEHRELEQEEEPDRLVGWLFAVAAELETALCVARDNQVCAPMGARYLDNARTHVEIAKLLVLAMHAEWS